DREPVRQTDPRKGGAPRARAVVPGDAHDPGEHHLRVQRLLAGGVRDARQRPVAGGRHVLRQGRRRGRRPPVERLTWRNRYIRNLTRSGPAASLQPSRKTRKRRRGLLFETSGKSAFPPSKLDGNTPPTYTRSGKTSNWSGSLPVSASPPNLTHALVPEDGVLAGGRRVLRVQLRDAGHLDHRAGHRPRSHLLRPVRRPRGPLRGPRGLDAPRPARPGPGRHARLLRDPRFHRFRPPVLCSIAG